MASTAPNANPFPLGTVEVGVVLATMLHGLLTLKTYSYLHESNTDPLMLRLVISLIWVGSSVHVGCAMWMLYITTITCHGLPIELMQFPLALPIGCAVGAVIHCTVQSVYIYRMYKFGHEWTIPLLCCALTGYELGSGITFSVVEAQFNSGAKIAQFESQWSWLFYSFLAATASVDVCIAVSTSYYLLKGRAQLKRTKYLIDRLIVWTIQTGVATSITAVTVIILFAVQKESNAWLGVYIFLTNLYPLALMALLNGRARLKPKDLTLHTIHVTTAIQDNSIRRVEHVPIIYDSSSKPSARPTTSDIKV